MDQIISKELLSQVYNFEVKEIIKLGIDDVTYEVRFNGLRNGLRYKIINISELEKKCLRWGWDKGYSFEIIPFCVGIINLGTHEQKSFRYDEVDMKNKIPFLSKYVFKGCEYIRKELLNECN